MIKKTKPRPKTKRKPAPPAPKMFFLGADHELPREPRDKSQKQPPPKPCSYRSGVLPCELPLDHAGWHTGSSSDAKPWWAGRRLALTYIWKSFWSQWPQNSRAVTLDFKLLKASWSLESPVTSPTGWTLKPNPGRIGFWVANLAPWTVDRTGRHYLRRAVSPTSPYMMSTLLGVAGMGAMAYMLGKQGQQKKK